MLRFLTFFCWPAVGLFFLGIGCIRSPYHSTNKLYYRQAREYAKGLRRYPLVDSMQASPYFAGTTNFTLRRPNFVVIHHTAQSTCDSTLLTFTTTRTQVSAHYVICRDGTVFHLLNDYFRAHHAGVSRWGNTTDLNSSSIGIELDNNGLETFSDAQLTNLLLLLERLKKSYGIPQANFLGHADVAPGRKVDPSRFFPWQTLAEKGYGYWYDTLSRPVPERFDPLQALRLIGYSLRDTLAAIQSYKIHFRPTDTTRVLSETDYKVLADLLYKYQ